MISTLFGRVFLQTIIIMMLVKRCERLQRFGVPYLSLLETVLAQHLKRKKGRKKENQEKKEIKKRRSEVTP